MSDNISFKHCYLPLLICAIRLQNGTQEKDQWQKFLLEGTRLRVSSKTHMEMLGKVIRTD